MNWLRKFMAGRNGGDQLNTFLILLTFALEIVGLFVPGPLLTLIAWIPLLWAIFRMFSRNLTARRAENMKFLQAMYRIRGWFGRVKQRAQDSKTHRIFKCPQCGQKLRVPKHAGKVRITCPKCGNKIERRT